jgi:hypothetical protein
MDATWLVIAGVLTIVDGTAKVTMPPAARSFVNALARDAQGTSGRQ